MQLNVLDRVRIGSFLPQQADRVTLTVVRDIMNKVEFTQAERELIGMRPHPTDPASLMWGGSVRQGDKLVKTAQDDIVREFDFTDAELKVLKEEEKKKNDAKTLTFQDLELSEKIQAALLSSERKAVEPKPEPTCEPA